MTLQKLKSTIQYCKKILIQSSGSCFVYYLSGRFFCAILKGSLVLSTHIFLIKALVGYFTFFIFCPCPLRLLRQDTNYTGMNRQGTDQQDQKLITWMLLKRITPTFLECRCYSMVLCFFYCYKNFQLLILYQVSVTMVHVQRIASGISY